MDRSSGGASVSKFLSVGQVSDVEVQKIRLKANATQGKDSGDVLLEDGVAMIEGLFDAEAMQSAYVDALTNFIFCVRNLFLSGRKLSKGTKNGYKEIVKRTAGRYECIHGMREIFDKYFSQNEYLRKMLLRIFGDGYHLIYADLLISFEGAEDQQWHVDGGHRLGSKVHLPPDVINVFVALDDISIDMGPTIIRPGTHKLTRDMSKQILGAILTKRLRRKAQASCKRGDCLAFDYRTLHRGARNDSNRPRPVAGLVFASKSYRADFINFPKRSMFTSTTSIAMCPSTSRGKGSRVLLSDAAKAFGFDVHSIEFSLRAIAKGLSDKTSSDTHSRSIAVS